MRSTNVHSRSQRTETTRRQFLQSAALTTGAVLAQPLAGAAVEPVLSERRLLLKNGLLVDGTGKKGAVGHLLIRGKTIEAVSERPIDIECDALDCTGKVIAPGFIDVHSHMDWVLAMEGRPELKSPFIAQGCTTFVAGNCGHGVAGFRRNSPHKEHINPGLFGEFGLAWDSMAEYFDHLGRIGMSHNLVNLAGHGTTRLSMRWDDPSPLSTDEMQELLRLLEEALDEGAWGVSFGLQYSPGIFATSDELKQVAQLVARKGKVLSVHGRAYSCLSPGYEINLFGGTPHNVLALQEMVDLARETDVRLQYSHLMFAGTESHRSYRQCLDVIDQARDQGVDVMTDTYPYHCGTSVINVVLPAWFREDMPANFHNEEALKRLEGELSLMSPLVGFGYGDIQITNANDPELNQYNGLFVSEIAEKRGISPFQAAMLLSERGGRRGAWVLNHNYSNMEVIDALIQHPACLFMSDAVPAKGVKNPAAYGAFPLTLQYARDRELIPLEEAVRKMTGASAERLGVKDRGLLKPGLAADVTVFDWSATRDNNTVKDTGNAPTGIHAVFINGRQVLRDGQVDPTANAGVVVA